MKIRERILKVKLSVLIRLILLCLLPFTVTRPAYTYSASIAFEAIFTPYINCIIDGNRAPTKPLVSPIVTTRNVTRNLSLFTSVTLGFFLGLSVGPSTFLEAHGVLDSQVKDEPYPTQSRRSMDASRSGPTPTLDTGTPRRRSTVWIYVCAASGRTS